MEFTLFINHLIPRRKRLKIILLLPCKQLFKSDAIAQFERSQIVKTKDPLSSKYPSSKYFDTRLLRYTVTMFAD